MKKYTQPELSISMFDIEDVITNSGTMFSGDGTQTALQQIASELGGVIVDANDKEVVSTTAAAYFGWTE